VIKDRSEEAQAEFFKKPLLKTAATCSGQPKASSSSTSSKMSALDVGIIRNEDPLVALKVVFC
jgi:hypothetical protein